MDMDAEKSFEFFQALTHMADCLNLMWLSDVLSDICYHSSLLPSDNERNSWVALLKNRTAWFLSKIVVGSCGQLFLKLSLFGTKFDTLWRSSLGGEFWSMLLAIFVGFDSIAQQMPKQWAYALIPES